MLIQNSHQDVQTPTGTMRVHLVSPKCVNQSALNAGNKHKKSQQQ